MRQIMFVATLSAFASSAAATPPVEIDRDTCMFVVINQRSDGDLAPDVELFLDGVVAGVEAANPSRQDILTRIVASCIDDPYLSIASAIAVAVSD